MRINSDTNTKLQSAILRFLICAFVLPSANTIANECRVLVSEHQPIVIELYTSEGCSSCPPADRWLAQLDASKINETLVIPLALHVDYWDYIGWKDRFAQQQFSARQTDIVKINKLSSAFTPQFVVNGKNFTAWRKTAAIKDQVALASTLSAPVKLSAQVSQHNNEWIIEGDVKDSVDGNVKDTTEQIRVNFVVTEDQLKNDVTDGENNGKLLEHHAVIRRWTPMNAKKTADSTHFIHREKISPEWKPTNLRAYILVENKQLQTLAAARIENCLH
jgi:hypothetical protein